MGKGITGWIFNGRKNNWRTAAKKPVKNAYLKASYTGPGTDVTDDNFGYNVSLNADGNKLAVSAYNEDGNATGITGIGGAQGNGISSSGAVYTFTRSGVTWAQQACLKASNTGANDRFGQSVAFSSDGDTLAVGASTESSNARGVSADPADQTDNSATSSGAVYLY